jgi:glycosyltransferase involved in cell wall biosynthesis
MPPSPQLSIVIPVYNEESIVEQAATELTQGLDQRGWDYEIIFAENGSRDRTQEILERMTKANPRLKWFHSERPNYGVALKLDFKGTQALELVTRMRQGEILRSIVNGRGVDYVVIDRPITDGIFTIWEGVGDEVVAEMAKKYPTITGMKSASVNFDMTPSTKDEKKKAFRLFKQSEREATTEKTKSKKEEAAAIRSPAASAATIDPLSPLPEGAP